MGEKTVGCIVFGILIMPEFQRGVASWRMENAIMILHGDLGGDVMLVDKYCVRRLISKVHLYICA